MKHKPSVFKLAHLAASVPFPTRAKDAVKRAWEILKESQAEIDDHESRAEFLRNLFWTPSGKKVPVFTDRPKAWEARIKAYPGDQRDVSKAMWEDRFPNEEVQKQLFKDKNFSRDNRQQLFVGLARASIYYDMEGPVVACAGKLKYLGSVGGVFGEPQEGYPIHPKNQEYAEEHHRKICRGYGKMLIPMKEVWYVEKVKAMLSEPKLNAHLVRWAVEVRQKQLAISKTRVIPPGVRRKFEDDDHDDSVQVKRKHTQ
jgi:hypothetical protein